MSPLFKCLLGLAVILCFMQCVELARLPRDDAAADSGAGNEIADTVKNLIENLRKQLDNDNVKNFIQDAAKAISEGTKRMTEELGRVGKEIQGEIAKSST